MRTAILTIVASLLMLACRHEPAQDADPCARASANARRLAADEAAASARYGADPLPLARCRALPSREEVKCLGYASSWDELAACSPGALQPASVAGVP